MFGPGLSVEVIYAQGDNDHRAPLLLQPGLALCYGQMSSIGPLCQSKLPSVMVELPNPRRVTREGLWSRQILQEHQHRHVLGQNSSVKKAEVAKIKFKHLN